MQTLIEQIEKCGFIHQPVTERSTSAVNCFFDYDSKKTYTTYSTGYVRVDQHTPVSRKLLDTEEERLLLILRIAKKNSYGHLLTKADTIREKILKCTSESRFEALVASLEKIESRLMKK